MTNEAFEHLLKHFQPITLDDMKTVRLMNRTDVKFVTTEERLFLLLERLTADYYVQQVDGKRLSAYETVYFDTPTFDMFYRHQSGHANRQKLRFRTYVDSQLRFMEVKTKNNHGRTSKRRMRVADVMLDDTDRQLFLREHLRYDASALQPVIRNTFRRITLVNKAKTERLTIDVDLHFDNLITRCEQGVSPLVIIELKRDGRCASPILAHLRDLRIHPHGFSKYCIGSALTNKTLRLHSFKQKLREIEKIKTTPVRC